MGKHFDCDTEECDAAVAVAVLTNLGYFPDSDKQPAFPVRTNYTRLLNGG